MVNEPSVFELLKFYYSYLKKDLNARIDAIFDGRTENRTSISHLLSGCDKTEKHIKKQNSKIPFLSFRSCQALLCNSNIPVYNLKGNQHSACLGVNFILLTFFFLSFISGMKGMRVL